MSKKFTYPMRILREHAQDAQEVAVAEASLPDITGLDLACEERQPARFPVELRDILGTHPVDRSPFRSVFSHFFRLFIPISNQTRLSRWKFLIYKFFTLRPTLIEIHSKFAVLIIILGIIDDISIKSTRDLLGVQAQAEVLSGLIFSWRIVWTFGTESTHKGKCF